MVEVIDIDGDYIVYMITSGPHTGEEIYYQTREGAAFLREHIALVRKVEK
jgi:hypothetical protein